MNQEEWKRAKSVALAALELPADERDKFIQSQLGSAPELLAVARQLLASPHREDRFLEPPAGEPFAPQPRPERIGEFKIERELGRGGMGVVYLAEQPALGRRVALKVLPWYLADDDSHVERFHREVRAIGRLRHPHIATVFGAGVAEGVHYLAMEYLEHGDVQELLAVLRTGDADNQPKYPKWSFGSPSYIGRVIDLARQVAAGLVHAHAAGVVHRDIKPRNLVFESENAVKLVDFGLARDESAGSISRAGSLFGTPDYMSPEQVSLSRIRVDERTDIYSLGVVMYELLTLSRPFRGRSDDELFRDITIREPRSPRLLNPRVSSDLECVVLKAIAKDPHDRYVSAQLFEDDLRRLLAHEAVTARPTPVLKRLFRSAKRHRTALAAAAVVATTAFMTAGTLSSRTKARQISKLSEDLSRIRSRFGPMDEASTIERLELRRVTAELLTYDLRNEIRGRVLGVREELESYLSSKLEEALRQLRGSAAEDDAEVSRDIRGRAVGALADLYAAFPEDERVRAALDPTSFYARISASAVNPRGEIEPAMLSRRLVDWRTGEPGPPVEMGALPLSNELVRPGYYRFVVRFSRGGTREFVRRVGEQEQVEILASVREDERLITRSMVRYGAGAFTVPAQLSRLKRLEGQVLSLDAFYLDEAEVTNGEYEKFLTANSGMRLPTYWVDADARTRVLAGLERPLVRWDELPVVGVTWYEALAYAEWSGKRLPTNMELQRAGRGLEGRLYPRSDWDQRGGFGNMGHPDPEFPPPSIDAALSWYLRWCDPSRARVESATSEGVLHLHGNVCEWTESVPALGRGVGGLSPSYENREYLATDWRSGEAADLRNWGYSRTDVLSATYFLGFRCAKGDS